MVTRLKPQRVKSSNSPQVGQNLGYEDSNNFKWQDTGTGVGDMNYADFEWQTLTGNAITIEDISNNITPSSDFTVSAGTVKPGIEYILRVNTGNTPYTMTLGTGVTNPNSYKTELKPNTVNQFKFIATSTNQLELEGVDSAVVSEINWGEIDGTLSNQTDLQNALNSKADAVDVNTKTFFLSGTTSASLPEAQEAIDWYVAGNNPLIKMAGRLYMCNVFDAGYYALFTNVEYAKTSDSTKNSITNKIIEITLDANNNVTAISASTETVGDFLSTTKNYTTPYTPQYNGSPATKKYVDDQVSAATAGAVSDTAYGSGWDGVTGIAPSKNAVYDKISTMDNAISGNTTNINTINSKIPSEASASNQLADKDYVGDSINSVTAFYITKNAQGDQFATYAELAAATTFYSGGVARVPTKNDYTIVLADETHDNATTRYIYNNGWEYQYTVNETALTQAQLNAINSGITAAKVTQYDGYATSKQDVLTAGDNIDINNNVISAEVNTKTFYASVPSQWNVTLGQQVYDWIKSGNYAILQYGIQNVVIFTPTNTTTGSIYSQGYYTVRDVGDELENVATTYGITVSNGTVTAVEVSPSISSAGHFFEPGGTATTGYVVTKTASGYEWQAPSGGIEVDANSPIQITKIRAGTQAQYDALGSYDATTVYLTI